MKKIYSIISISVVLLFSCLVSCSTDDETDSSSGTGTATAIIDSETGKKAKVKWVQLWKDGPKFAEYNLGVIDGKPESYGSTYQWYTFLDGKGQISNFPWGDNWRIPTKEELESLIEYCLIEWTIINDVQGITVRGVGDYSDNSIFLPACHKYEHKDNQIYLLGRYWSSTPESGSNAYWLSFYEKELYPKEVTYNGAHRYMSIRPVLADKEDKGSASEMLNLIGTWDGKITQNVTFNAILFISADGTYNVTSEKGFNNFGGKWTDNGNGTVTLTNFFDPTFNYTLNEDKLLLAGNGWSASFTRRH